MARRQVIDCDGCKALDVPDPIEFSVPVGISPCPAGGPSETDCEDVHLCPACAARHLRAALKELGHEAAKKWVENVRFTGRLARSKVTHEQVQAPPRQDR